jgi:hypothetical protein
MKKIMVILALGLAIVAAGSGCTDNTRAKHFGGTSTESLPKGTKLVNVTWKENSLWVLTKPMRENDVAESYTFKESSSFGLVQGTVFIVESK